MLNFAVEQANDKILQDGEITLKAGEDGEIEYGNEINAGEKICELLQVRTLNYSYLKITKCS